MTRLPSVLTTVFSLLGRWGPEPSDAPCLTLLDTVAARSLDGVMVVRENGAVEFASRAALEMLDRRLDEIIGRKVGDLVRPAGATDDEESSRLILGGLPVPRDTRIVRSNGSTISVELTATPVVQGGQRRIVAVLRDVTLLPERQRRLRHRATHDALTDLPNRYLLDDRAGAMVKRARMDGGPSAVLLVDLDRFKEINDALGHQLGDVLLRRIARRLEDALDRTHTLARLGGDEFVALLPDTHLTSARRRAWRLVRSLEEPFRIEGLELHVTASVGIALFPDDGNDANELIRRADAAMFAAKRARAGVSVYHDDHDSEGDRRQTLTGDLCRAIESDELTLHYQPKLDAGGRVVGAEALARWEHPRFGFVPPDEFIRLAEQTGLIWPLTRRVVENAAIQCARWVRQGYEFGISVNVSAHSLLEEELPRLLERLLAATGLPAGRFTLEITESAIMEDPERAFDVVIELCSLGIGLAIDDFGTGYSSLGYLKKLPATELKIDKSFVMELDRNQDDATIVRSIIDLAHNLGLQVVAEGVETAGVWNQLRKLGCDAAQGYLFGRPLPPDRFAEWLVSRNRSETLGGPAAVSGGEAAEEFVGV
jgi:diguanylate cyclase (GGDEF)-like protein/PAS domain S-box-containing protein